MSPIAFNTNPNPLPEGEGEKNVLFKFYLHTAISGCSAGGARAVRDGEVGGSNPLSPTL